MTASLHKNPRNAIGLAKEIEELIPTTMDRQIYKLLFPLVQFQCRPQLNYLVGKHIVAPIVENDFEKFRSPTNYSMLMMTLGYQFITDPKYANKRDPAPEGPFGEADDEKPFRFSLFSRFAYELKTNHLELLRSGTDYPLLIHLLQTYALNSSLDWETIDLLLNNITNGIDTEEKMADLDHRQLIAIIRSIKLFQLMGKREDLKSYLDLASKVYLAATRKEEASRTGPKPKQISKENIAVREALEANNVKFIEETALEDALYSPDFYLPEQKVVIEINGNHHFYPYTTRFMNFTNARNKIMRGKGYKVVNLNSSMLEGLIRQENKAGLHNLIGKIANPETA